MSKNKIKRDPPPEELWGDGTGTNGLAFECRDPSRKGNVGRVTHDAIIGGIRECKLNNLPPSVQKIRQQIDGTQC